MNIKVLGLQHTLDLETRERGLTLLAQLPTGKQVTLHVASEQASNVFEAVEIEEPQAAPAPQHVTGDFSLAVPAQPREVPAPDDDEGNQM